MEWWLPEWIRNIALATLIVGQNETLGDGDYLKHSICGSLILCIWFYCGVSGIHYDANEHWILGF